MLLFVPLSVLIGSIFYLIYQNQIDHLQSNNRAESRQVATLVTHYLGDALGSVVHDVRYLAEHHALQAHLLDGNHRNLATLAKDFAAFARAKGVYDQVRYIDAEGYEVVRINFAGNKASIVPADRLQAKAHRYYFQESLGLRPGQVYLSRFDLNIEHQQIEQPIKPMLRVTTPVFDPGGTIRGVVVVNYLGRRLLERIHSKLQPGSTQVELLDGEGYWLLSEDSGIEWGFMYPDRMDNRLAQSAPKIWQAIGSAPSGDIVTPDFFYHYRRVWPSDDAKELDSLVFSPGSGYPWIVLVHLPTAAQGLVSSGLLRWLVMTYILLTAIALGGAFIAWRFSVSLNRQREAEAGQRRSRLILQTFVDNSPSVVFIKDAQGRHLLVNRRMEEVLGLEREQIVGRTDKELFADHPQLAEFFHNSDRRVLETGTVFEQETMVEFAEGRRRTFIEHKFPLYRDDEGIYAVGGIATEITARKRAEEALLEREARLRAIVDGSIDAIIVIDERGIVQSFNLAAEQMFGISKADMIGTNISRLMPQPHRSQHDQYIRSYLHSGEAHIIGIGREVEGLRADGSRFPMDLEVTRVEFRGDCRFVGLIRDITQRKVAERKLAESEALKTAILNAARYGIVSTDANGVIRLFSETARQLFDYGEDEVLGKQTPLLFHREPELEDCRTELLDRLDIPVNPGFPVLVAEAVHGQPAEREWTCVKKTGEQFPVMTSVSVLRDPKGVIEGYALIYSDITEARALRDELQYLATTDPLTELANRRQFLRLAKDTRARAQRYQRPFSVMILDVDHFKRVNDSYGHVAGDQALKQLAACGSEALRGTDTLCRFGGEEFAVLLPETGIDDALVLAERLRQTVAQQDVQLEQDEIHITVSIGVAEWREQDSGVDDVITRADQALYQAKEQGRNRVLRLDADSMDDT